MKKVLVGLLVIVLALVGVGAWRAYTRVYAPARTGPDVAQAERALAAPGVVVLASFNATYAAALERVFLREALRTPVLPVAAEGDESLVGHLWETGIDPRRDLAQAMAAVIVTERGETQAAMLLLGRFDPRAVTAFLTSRLVATEKRVGGKRVFEVEYRDPDSCRLSAPRIVYVDAGRLLVAEPAIAESLLARLDGQAPGGPDIGHWQAFRAGQLFSLVAFVPKDPGRALAGTPAGAYGGAAAAMAGSFNAGYFGVSVRPIPGDVGLHVVIRTSDARVAEQVAVALRQGLVSARSGLGTTRPAAAGLLDAVKVDAKNAEVQVLARLDGGRLATLRQLSADMGQSMLGAAGLAGLAAGAAGAGDQADARPLAFEDTYPLAKLPAFQPDAHWRTAPDVTAGPFGIRLAALRLRREPGVGPEVEIQAYGHGIRNIDDGDERVTLRVTKVAAGGQDNVLAAETCGPDRNDRPARLRRGPGGEDGFDGAKRVRVKAGVAPEAISRVSGEVTVRLPVRLERVLVPARGSEASIARHGATVQLSGVHERGFAYRVTGDGSKVLHVRGLGADRKPLAGQARMQGGGGLLGRGKAGVVAYAGTLEQVEVIFAAQEAVGTYPFELTRLHPGTDGEQLLATPAFVPVSRAQLQLELTRPEPPLPPPGPGRLAAAAAGPFTVVLERVDAVGTLRPGLAVQGPRLPNLLGNLSAVQLAVRELGLTDGRVHLPPPPAVPVTPAQHEAPGWDTFLVLSRQEAAAPPGARWAFETGQQVEGGRLARIGGLLRVRLPVRVRTVRMEDLRLGRTVSGPGGMSARLDEIGRDRLVFFVPAGRERLVAVKALNARGQQLRADLPELARAGAGWTVQLEPRGLPARVEFLVAEEAVTRDYAFELDVPRLR